jgi:predicted AAA+ superfamily ATPase
MIARLIEEEVKRWIGKYSIITLTGPRQSGKTTLLKSIFPDWQYVSLETPDSRSLALDDPRSFLKKYGDKIILDEVQRAPDLLSYIQTITDEDPSQSFIISGSHNLLMLEYVSQSLAGRTAILYLLPFSLKELSGTPFRFERYEEWIFQGFYPRIYDRQIPPQRFYSDYLETYVQRDVRQVKNIGDLNLFMRFMSLCAGRIGQTLNYSQLANDVGVSVTSVRNWLSVLETSFIAYQLNPYFRNFKKRITKATKLYFYDTGLACSLLRLKSPENLETYYNKGALFENFVINEICKSYYNRGERPPIYYWRDSKGREIDLIIDQGNSLIPIEIKSGATYHSDFFKNIEWWSEIADVPVGDRFVIYGGEKDWDLEHGKLRSWTQVNSLIPG